MKLNNKQKVFISICLIAIAISTRFLPHLWNFTAITGIAIFASNYLGLKWSFVIVFLSMFLSDIFIGFYDIKLMFVIYLSFILVSFLPKILKGNSVIKIAGLSLSGSFLFFFITNWAVWYFETMYSPNLSGLISSYVAGIPFLKNALIGDLWYTFVLFGAYEFVLILIKKTQDNKVIA